MSNSYWKKTKNKQTENPHKINQYLCKILHASYHTATTKYIQQNKTVFPNRKKHHQEIDHIVAHINIGSQNLYLSLNYDVEMEDYIAT